MSISRPVRRPLPRGAHGLPREFVLHHQRERMLDAMVDAVAELGYGNATVAHVLERAKVSRRTFYEHYSDKEECFLAAYDMVVAKLGEEVSRAYREDGSWAARVRAVIDAFLRFMAAEPAFARIAVVEVLAAGPRALERYASAVGGFRPFLEEGRKHSAHGDELPDGTEDVLLGGAVALVYGRVVEGRASELPAVLPDLVYMVTLPYLGHEEARAVAGAA